MLFGLHKAIKLVFKIQECGPNQGHNIGNYYQVLSTYCGPNQNDNIINYCLDMWA